MTDTTTQNSQPTVAPSTVEIRRNLRAVDRKVWWHWWNAALVIMLLMGAVASLSLPADLPGDSAYQLDLALAVRGLLGLILIFNIYMLYQQYLLRALRNNLARQIELAAEQEVRAEMFEELAILDPLTGLYNRRYGDDHLRREIARSDRSGDPFILLLLDLDKFKEINDQFGHPAGDLVLKEFARRVNKSIRGSDTAVRVGGDEFMVMLPECPPEKIGVVTSRLDKFEVEIGREKISVHCSKGWAQYLANDTAEDLIKRADEALYAHKSALNPYSDHDSKISSLRDPERLAISKTLNGTLPQAT